MTRRARSLFYALLFFFAAFTLYPLYDVVRLAFMPEGYFTLHYFATLLSTPIMQETLLNTVLLSLTTTALCLLIALPLALIGHRVKFPGHGLCAGLLLVPLILPPFVGALGMKQLLSRFGCVNLGLMKLGVIEQPIDWLGANPFWGVALMMSLHLFPLLYLNITAALGNLDDSLVDAAASVGASPFSRFRRITLPLIMPGILAGSMIVALWALTDLGTPLVFEYRRVVAVQIFDRVTDMHSNPDGYALVVVVLALSALVLALSRKLTAGGRYHIATKGAATSTLRPVSRPIQVLALFFFVVTVALALLPHAAVILTALQADWFMTLLPEHYTVEHVVAGLGAERTLAGIRISLFLSTISTIFDLILGIAVAVLLVRGRFAGRGLLDFLVMMPLAVPGLVMAFGYLSGFSGTWLDPRDNPLPLLAIAYTVRRLPFVVRSIHAGLLQLGPSLEEAAQTLGSTRGRALRRIALPLIAPHILGGAILAFAFAMLEVSDSLMLALKDRFYPLTKVMYDVMGEIDHGPEMAAGIGLWAMAFLALAFLAASAFLGRRMGHVFRM